MPRSSVVLVTGIAILTVVSTVASSRQSKDTQDEKARAKSVQFEAELADATEAQFGSLTECQRFNSRLLYPYRTTSNGTIRDLLTRDDGSTFFGLEVSGCGQELIEPQTPENYFGELLSASDAVIHCTATKRTSAITDDEAFIFSDYDVVLEEVLKDKSDKQLRIGATITVTRPGGKIVINGIIIKAHSRGYEPLPLNRPLLLFLKYIPETDVYHATRDVGTFEIEGSSIRSLSMSPYPPGVLRDGVSSLQIIRVVSTK